ncbi:hypothetical protein [Novosphingobium sp. Gsoil 351]|uniref:hypothetical protein n=1 Tax=Novosphingobium sp. Gsoil 351 TaxID=2675225 RepID=UPI0012B49DBE|nr:hypothetical protein [Novosphingobium sp. Gsoil 351]QGN54974.1 hypothetical protein GKE62_10825 [Novosphingobium sp. Gsoil 351]
MSALALAAFAAPVAAENLASRPAQAWEIGPNIRGRDYSVGMPNTPQPTRSGWSFDFPYPDDAAGHVHYVTTPVGSMAGAHNLTVRYRIEGERGASFVSRETPTTPATVSLYFQRRGDPWRGKRFEMFRWYAPEQTLREIAPGTYEMRASFNDDGWISVWGKSSGDYREAFEAALADADRIGLTFGAPGARGHGVFATAPARFTLLSYDIN